MALRLRTDCPILFPMIELSSFREVIELWPSREAMAGDLASVTSGRVSKWWQRRSIPAEYWSAVLATERARENGVTAELLANLASREFAEPRL